MGTQSTGGGSTTSFVNTPQAKDDSYCYSEDALRNSALYNATTKAVTLDVMSNDLGGSAKSLFSIDDGNGNVLSPDFELLCKDVNASGCSPWEKTPDGNWIRINNGKIEFKLGNPDYPDDPAKALDLSSLGTDRSVDDEFVYAIRLANGTLSQATVRIHITGENDAVVLGAVTDASINDGPANDSFSDIIGKLTSTDEDFGDTPTYGIAGSSASDDPAYDVMMTTAYGTLYLDEVTGDYRFVPNDAAINALDSDDAAVALDFTVTVSDGDSTDSDTLTITLNGANDTPELAAVTDATINDGAGNDSFANITGTLVGSDRDAGETLQYGLTGAVASDDPDFDWMSVTAYGTLYLDKDSGAYKFVADNGAIQALDSDDAAVNLNFAVNVSDGDANAGDTLTITINGANDTPDLAAVTDVTLTDTGADDSFGFAGNLLGTDRDAGETLQYGLTGAVASDDPDFDWMKATAYGTLYVDRDSGAYEFVGNDAAINGLDSDDTDVVLNFGLSVSDGDASASDTLSVTLKGANDLPEVANAIADQSSPEDTDVLFQVPGNTFSDRDLGETLTYSATLQGGAALPAWLDFDAATRTFSGTPPQDFNGSLNITVTADDGDATVSDTFTLAITAVNDKPVNTMPAAGYSTNEDTAKALTGLSVADVDAGGGTVKVTLSVNSGTLAAAGTPSVAVLGSGSGSIQLSGTVAAINAFLAATAPVFTPAANANGDVTLTMITDDQGNSGSGGAQTDSDSVTISVAAVNDAAVITGTDTGSVTEDAVPNTVSGDLNSTDVDGTNDLWNAQTIASANSYGSLVINANGTWTYTLDNANPTVNALNTGSPALTDTFTVQTADGTQHDIIITINGHTDFTYTSPPPYTLGGDPNDFDSLGNPAGQNISSSATNGDDILYGGAGNDTINAGGGNDTVYAGSGTDTTNGGADNDRLFGGSGTDTVVGGNDNDVIVGGYGADTLTGANGADTFCYLSQRDTGDTIIDFSKVQGDKIKFDTVFGFDATDFSGALSAAGAVDPGKFGYKFDAATNTTIIYVDTDGVFGADMEIKLTGNIALTSGDFLFGAP